ncbi:4-(cytidine 5'-diphospho)-2-C-methyl-D-erythritol kinase [Tuberibacillus sp. Marseille-P3662]|uniref:4-(cytidine 5'-diphospho)-2-C-methyl-D-erythritol kinase n=1 Tax=Tuberibacillus sp. Marseille-P3662 TaxID=1965358 RepID=UPI000A1CD6A0|nr:4-(cytidine 5'-diphospho)-2-C-methyl-D-erythritol kinase [Tuberibacillus sp. Marseille-P3662]
MRIVEKAPAKINLSLDVLHKRDDGYHEVNMIMTTIDLSDRIEIIEQPTDDINIVSSATFIPEDRRNLAFQAAELIKQNYNINQGIKININKHIPVAAGLAGGSSDAAATIRALNKLWDLNMSTTTMMDLASQIGSDVSFCINGGTALASGRGNDIQPLPSPPSCWVVLAKPDLSVSTAEVYGGLNLNQADHPNVSAMVRAIEQQDYRRMCALMGNTLENVTMQKYLEVKQIKEHMIRMDADGVLMSGSGPTVFGLIRHESRAQRIYNSLNGFCHYVHAVRLYGAQSALD